MSSPEPGIAVHTITFEAVDPRRLAEFWMRMLGYRVEPNHTTSVQIGDPHGRGPRLLFAPSTRPKETRNRVHLDLRPDDSSAAVAQALELGATRIGHEEASWTRLADPEGNEFCILQSAADFERFVAEHGPGEPSI